MKQDTWLDAVMDALDAMVARTCPSMRTLWLAATLKRRRHWLGDDVTTLPASVVPPGWRNLSKSSRSKYGALAVWRHAVVWKLLHFLERTGAPRYEELQSIWFSPYPDDLPPFAWSQRLTQAPSTGRATDLRRRLAADACCQTILELRSLVERRDFDARGSMPDMREDDLLVDATRETLLDVLKLQDTLEASSLARLRATGTK